MNMKSNKNESIGVTGEVFMCVDVILTFDKPNMYGETQEFFGLMLQINGDESSAAAFINQNLFDEIADKCYCLDRCPEDLIKISTASDWQVFKDATQLPSLWELGHCCKWYFGQGRDDLDTWEIELANEYGFGTDVDMSWMKNPAVDFKSANSDSIH